MSKQTKLKPRKDAVFVCQINESYIKIIRCITRKALKKEFSAAIIGISSSEIGRDEFIDKVSQVFNDMGYKSNNPIIVSLSAKYATCRYLNVPSQSPQEITNIISLQASRFLPYSPEELITAFDIISREKDGSSYINQIILHKDIVEYGIRIFEKMKSVSLSLVLSSYGLCNLYNYLLPKNQDMVAVLDVDSKQTELIVINDGKLLFNRAFSLLCDRPNWQDTFVEEIIKSKEAFVKGISKQPLSKLVLLGQGERIRELADILKAKIGIEVEILPYYDKINITGDIPAEDSNISLSSLIGFALKEPDKNWSLSTGEFKEKARKSDKIKRRIRNAAFIAAFILIFSGAVIQDLNNRERYSVMLNGEVKKIAKEAKKLEDIDRRLKLLESRSREKSAVINILYEFYQILPEEMNLSNFSYEEDKQLLLRGQSKDLKLIYDFAAALKKSEEFKKFNIDVKYVTRKETKSGELVDFEIVCVK